MSDVTIVIPTYGDLEVWGPLADRAQASAEDQTVASEVIRVHGPTLAKARNDGGCRAQGSQLVFLDADDELEPGYVKAMLAATGDLRQPATLAVVDGVADHGAVLIPPRPLWTGNFLVIGTMVPKALFLDVGGFFEEAILEDWSFFLRCWLEGATIGPAPDAIYRVHIRSGSRNEGDLHHRVFNELLQRYLPVARARGLA